MATTEKNGPAMTLPDLRTLRLARPREGVAVLTLSRPDRLNAMTNEMFRELEAVALHLGRDDALRVLVVTGAGRGFCAGYDLDEAEHLAGLTPMGMIDQQELAVRAVTALRGIRVPVIAAVNGAAAGGGLALALAADFRFAAPSATFTIAFVRIGLSAGDLGTSWLLPRLIGPAAAAEFIYTGRTMDATEAERLGLVNRIVPDDGLLEACLSTAEAIAANSPGGIQLTKRALQANMENGSYAAALELENRGQALLTRTEDMTEALTALREKRPARFTGR
ncbi:enoyl-CoA hydratase/carnithine racemase [Pseudonocardia sediminis]|uniref:Enoyl-CoA hydratase/carnithine racemase n=1 Tax=Pseudonocardia sediminis TaxID=1397368 RepID=A0A4Q7UZY4_PSEST|nr:enoyl-CoA hydratase-related protein [Pseudonocardia sediminis]RZT86714.1 enoyl-CoA hydratase/carnithine racemase [Pseudonocardia sediminis]